jgi:hypothetical protein
VWRRFAPDRARRELESLLAAARPDGFIGHTIFWNESLTGRRRYAYNVKHGDDPMTATIQPPLLAWAWRLAVGDPASEPAICAHHERVEAERDLEGDGLLWIVQPDESGMDASPQFDPVWGRRAHGRGGFLLLVWHNRRFQWNARRIRDAGGPVVCEPVTNVLHGLSRLALGRPSITPALVARLWDERSGTFRLAAEPAQPAPAQPGRPDASPLTWTAFAPLALPDLPVAIGRRLIEEHLLDAQRFWLPVPPPSVSSTDPAFTLDDRLHGLRRYWRGPTWVNAAYLAWLGLVRLGYEGAAAELARRLGATALRSGLWEYYDPYSGRGMGQAGFGWSSLVLELMDPDPGARLAVPGAGALP